MKFLNAFCWELNRIYDVYIRPNPRITIFLVLYFSLLGAYYFLEFPV